MIRFEQVTKKFADESFGALEQSFIVEDGQMVFVTGKSGSGKTTMMRLLTREYTPSSGEVWFDDTPLSQIKPGNVHLHRRHVGVVFQDYRLLPELTAWENIALPLSILNLSETEIHKRVEDLLLLVKLENKAQLFPSQLSGGEAQRVSIARALAMSPKVLFADEPTGNLDPETSNEIAHLLEKINVLGTTIFFATHDQSLLEKFGNHRILSLSDGQIIQDTKPAQEPKTSKSDIPDQEKPIQDAPKKNPWHKLKSWGLPTLAKKPKVKPVKIKDSGNKPKNKSKKSKSKK